MIIPLALGAAALYGLYKYDQKKKMTAALNTPAPASGAAPSGYQYPTATSESNPNDPYIQGAVVRFQKAQPTPTGKWYQPVDGDLASIVSLRFDPETDASGKLLPGISPPQAMWGANLGKLNGFLSFSDLAKLIAAKKPIHLPAEATDKGARFGANGAITQR